MQNVAPGKVFDFAILEALSGSVVCSVTGKGASEAFRDESGGHRFQRVPPTEKRGRMQTSTITVAVLEEPTEVQLRIDPRDIEWKATRSSGSGGQCVNTTDSAVHVKHLPTGLMVRCETERSQKQNLASAMELLRARLWEAEQERMRSARAADRKQQVGTGMRGDKRRTIRYQDGQVHDSITGKRWNLKEYLRGDW